jgi:soluble lytic murein transglycosylase
LFEAKRPEGLAPKPCQIGTVLTIRQFEIWHAAPTGRSYNRRVKRLRIILLSLALCLAGAFAYLWFVARQGKQFEPQINEAAKRYHVDPLLVKAVIWQETRFHPDRRGKAGEIGLMQIQEAAALDWAGVEHIQNFSHEECFDPGTNALAGTFYLSKLLKRYAHADDPVPYALADYNAGRGNVLKWNGGAASTNSTAFISQIGFPGTRAYVKFVRRRYLLYKFLSQLE